MATEHLEVSASHSPVDLTHIKPRGNAPGSLCCTDNVGSSVRNSDSICMNLSCQIKHLQNDIR